MRPPRRAIVNLFARVKSDAKGAMAKSIRPLWRAAQGLDRQRSGPWPAPSGHAISAVERFHLTPTRSLSRRRHSRERRHHVAGLELGEVEDEDGESLPL